MSKEMIKIKLLLLFSTIMLATTAQTDEEVKTLFGRGKPDIGYFINPSCQFGEIAGTNAILPGIGAGVVFNDRIYLGINYKFIVSENTPDGELDTRLYLDQRYFGLRFEYAIRPEKVVHVNFPVELGIGETELDLKDSYEDDGSVPSGDASFAYLEPSAALEINVQKYVKLNFTAGYRFVSDLSFRNLKENDLMGITYSVGIKIGIF
jgi:hypothetical protein